MVGEDGQQYVTMYQDGNTYAIPLAQYQEMQASGGSTITIQVTMMDLLDLTVPFNCFHSSIMRQLHK